MLAATIFVFLLTTQCASGARQMVRMQEHMQTDAMSMEAQSSEITHAMFAQAFPEIAAAASSTCPYGDAKASKVAGTTSYTCHWKSGGMGKVGGNSCPELQKQRLKASHNFAASHASEYVENAKDFKLEVLFDKTEKVVGCETYEDMDALQIAGLEREEVAGVEDKIYLKKLAKELDVPATEMIFGAHKNDWDREAFKAEAKSMCEKEINNFIIKATHLAWSAGQKIVRNWQEICQREETLSAESENLAKFIEEEVLGQLSRDADAHLRFLEPGVTVEPLFHTGGNSLQPLEAKVHVLWGKAYSVLFVGSDSRGCQSQSGAWNVFGDKTGWDMQGMISPEGNNDEVSDRVLKNAFDKMTSAAERFAKGVGADFMRVDFFIGLPKNEGEDIEFLMNECESVSGWPFWYGRKHLGNTWVDGYLNRDQFSMTSEKWDLLMKKTKDERDALNLD